MSKLIKRALNKIDQLDPRLVANMIKKQLAETELYEAVLDSLRDGVILTEANHKLIYVNSVAKMLIPMRRPRSYDDVRVDELISDPDVVAYLRECWELGAENTASDEFHFQRGDTTRTITITLSSFKCAGEAAKQNGGVYELILLTDITERKRAESRLRRSESLASMTTMAAGVAHEIKNPLASIGIHLQLLRKAFERNGELTLRDASRYINVIDEEINRLNGIVVDFLFAVRPMDVHLRLQNLNRLLGELCDFVRPEYEAHGMSVQQDFGSIPKVQLDENLMKQALLNIINNAMSAMDAGGVLTVTTRLDGNHVLIKIVDTGQGIPEDTLGKIFEPYFTTKAAGTGLGLTVVYKVVKEHEGDISVASKVGEGTCFTISLPVPKGEWLALGNEYVAKDIQLNAEVIADEADDSDR